MRQADPTTTARCVFCGAKKVTLTRRKPGARERTEYFCIFHKPGCKLDQTKLPNGKTEAEETYPGIEHGGYVTADVFGG